MIFKTFGCFKFSQTIELPHNYHICFREDTPPQVIQEDWGQEECKAQLDLIPMVAMKLIMEDTLLPKWKVIKWCLKSLNHQETKIV